MSIRPAYDEYNEYFERYVKLVPEGNIREILTQSLKRTTDVFSTITEDQANYQYAPGKWKLKEVLGHITDNERIMSYRLLRIARGDKTPLSGYDQDDLMSGASFDTCPMSDILEDYTVVRQATFTLLRGCLRTHGPEEALLMGMNPPLKRGLTLLPVMSCII